MNRLLERTTPKKGRWKNWELVAVVEKSNNDSDDDSDDDSDNDSNDNSFEENTESELEEKAGNHNENKEESVRSNTSDIDNDDINNYEAFRGELPVGAKGARRRLPDGC